MDSHLSYRLRRRRQSPSIRWDQLGMRQGWCRFVGHRIRPHRYRSTELHRLRSHRLRLHIRLHQNLANV